MVGSCVPKLPVKSHCVPSPTLTVPLDDALELLEDELDELLELFEDELELFEDELELDVLEDEDELLEELAVSVLDPPHAANANTHPRIKNFFIGIPKCRER